MAEEARPWDAVFSRIRVIRAPEDIPLVVTEAELRAAETALGVPLPASYRAFATQFGLPGEFLGLVRLSRISARTKKQQRQTIAGRTRWLQDNFVDEFGAHTGLPEEQLRRFVFFGDDWASGTFAWDPGEQTATNQIEYPVYYSPCVLCPMQRQTDTFAEFVNWADTYFRQSAEDEKESLVAHIQWEPYCVRKKKRPLKRDITSWLAFNNNTARDLARSIRDERRADVFPILADALQDAGCAHADLLDACRTGDPDIDGKWVLQVLLGNP